MACPNEAMLNSIRNLTGNLGVAAEFLGFLWQRKLWWMIPMVLILLTLGVLIAVAASSAVSPFIYTIF